MDRSGAARVLEVQEKLTQIFGEDVPVLHSKMAARTVALVLALKCVGEKRVRPSTVLWATDAVLEAAASERERWYLASLQGREAVEEVYRSWGVNEMRWYAENTREIIRDEVLKRLEEKGAVQRASGLPTNSARPIWSIKPEFAELMKVQKSQFSAASKNFLPSKNQKLEERTVSIKVAGRTKQLECGESSRILKSVIEDYFQGSARVLFLTESRNKISYADFEGMLEYSIAEPKASGVLPDAIIGVSGKAWFVEVVATDGVITERRKKDLEETLVKGQSKAGFLTAFTNRNSAPFRKRFSEIARGTSVFFSDEKISLNIEG